MCGIFSIVPLYKQKTSRSLMMSQTHRALEVLKHRGPDEQSVWVDDNNFTTLGHVRLSIIDLDGGQQPLSSQDNTCHVVVNGEFYDFKNIRKQFVDEGYRFSTQSDSEIVLPLYKKYGTYALEKLRGEFAFILYDSDNKTVIASRDRFGIKPLYYCEYNGCLYISSEIKSLFAAGVPAIWDDEAYLSRSFYLSDRTLYKNIHQVPPGHFLHINNSSLRLHKYWDFNYPKQGKCEVLSESEIIEQTHTKLVDSVAQRLNADVDIAAYLSGGLDSSLVVSMASQLSGKKMNTFTLCFDNDDYNEQKYAQLVSDHVGAEFTPIKVSQSSLVHHFEKALWHNETPFFNAHGIAKYTLSKALNEAGFKVVLTGEGADEIFAGYPHFTRDMVLYNYENQEPEVVENIRQKILRHEQENGKNIMNNVPMLNSIFGTQFSWMGFQNRWMSAMANFYHKPAQDRFQKNHPFNMFLMQQDIQYQLKHRDPVHVAMYLWSKSYLSNFVLKTLGDRMEMANSIEGRLPFLDHLLVENVSRIPVSLKLKGGVSKYVLREIANKYLPESIAGRKKHYFRAPPAISSKSNPMREFIYDQLMSKHFESVPFFDADSVRMSLKDIGKLSSFDKEIYDGLLMEMVSLSLLGKQFGVV